MSAWNSVMQGLHSALIDELNLLYPDDKLELGLPSRHAQFTPPKNSVQACFSRVSVAEGFGLALLGYASHQKTSDLQTLFKAVIDRAMKHEFPRRGVVPQFGKLQNSPLNQLPSDIPPIQMVIWLPISIPGKNSSQIFDLGVAI